MKLQVSSAQFPSSSSPSASSRQASRPFHEHASVPYRKERQNDETVREERFRPAHPEERGAEQASVIGETERPPLPSERPEAS